MIKIFNQPHCNIFQYSNIIDSKYTTTLNNVKPMIDNYAKSKKCFITISPEGKDILKIESKFKRGKIKQKSEILDISKIDENTPFARAVFEAVDRVADKTGKYVKPVQRLIDETMFNLRIWDKA